MFIHAYCIGKLIKNVEKIRVLWRIFLKTISSAKGEERAASADCKLGRFKHKIVKRQHRIVELETNVLLF
jgi:hypothetical protein